MDRDTTARKGALVKILQGLRQGTIDILVGTQMVAKGHHYPNITLVGIICADLSLNFPDFRAGERTFQLLAQVAGRAGRGKSPGRVILQTFNPQHFCILTAGDQDYPAFYEHEIGFRRDLWYPPYSRLVQILVAGKDKEKTAQIKFLGPVAAPLARIKKQYRWQLLLKGQKTGSLHALTREIRQSDIRVVVDVDPVDML
jgi:primosomal protein N' (replication factor Y)